MAKIIKFPESIFSQKEITDFKRRQEVVRLLSIGESWKNIKAQSGAHLQTIAIISKRLKSLKQAGPSPKFAKAKTIYDFGRPAPED